MDGGFDDDKSLVFNYGMTTAITTTATTSASRSSVHSLTGWRWFPALGGLLARVLVRWLIRPGFIVSMARLCGSPGLWHLRGLHRSGHQGAHGIQACMGG
jgi:hypothetical protein